jgi:hypothetical protein
MADLALAHSGSGAMPGMMSADDMTKLAVARFVLLNDRRGRRRRQAVDPDGSTAHQRPLPGASAKVVPTVEDGWVQNWASERGPAFGVIESRSIGSVIPM